MAVDVQDIGCDFYAVTGHKLYGPSASGAIFISKERMTEMTPFMGGGDMIKEVHKEAVTYNDPPMIMEAGTPGIVQAIGLGVAIEYMMDIGLDNIALYENSLKTYANEKLSELDWLNIQGNDINKAAIFSFTIKGAGHPHDISTVLDKKGICVRAGHHCAQPLMEYLGVSSTCRASFGLYNTKDEVDSLVEGLRLCHELFG
jgi:cysteine desulfurase/selenocysteine lyase